jgi:hypothetical protein
MEQQDFFNEDFVLDRYLFGAIVFSDGVIDVGGSRIGWLP